MNTHFLKVASATRHIRLLRDLDQETAAFETGISLRTLQNIESGQAVSGSTLFAYLDYLDLLKPMLETLPDPQQLTPMEQLKTIPQRRERARKKATNNAPSLISLAEGKHAPASMKKPFTWGDEK